MSELKPPRTRAEMDTSLFGDEHVRAYRETGGARGYLWNDTHILLLTTRGRESGRTRITPLIFTRDGDRYVVVASKGGSPKHPGWYLNLQAEPKVEVQVKDEVFRAVARTVGPPERERLWDQSVDAWPQYEQYQAATSRQIPVVVLERA
jgi:deazaflavin-dependent oxidoreductase (nitroreductase family)